MYVGSLIIVGEIPGKLPRKIPGKLPRKIPGTGTEQFYGYCPPTDMMYKDHTHSVEVLVVQIQLFAYINISMT